MGDDRIPGVLQGRPLLDTRPDMAIYLERPTTEAALQDGIRRGLNVLLVGGRVSGKTTLLHRLLWQSRQSPRPERDVVLVRAGVADTAATFLHLVLVALGAQSLEQLSEPTQEVTAAATMRARAHMGGALTEVFPDAGLTTWNELATTQAALRVLREHVARQPRPVVVLVDDINPTVGNQVFGVLRDDLWSVDVQWVVTVNEDHANALLAPPADAFFDVRVQITDLDTAAASRLLTLRLGREVNVPDGTWRPRELLELARAGDPDRWADLNTLKSRQQTEISKLGRPALTLALVLDKLGPVSPSDERVLVETGWTRSRVSQVLQQLLEKGFVTYTDTATTGKAGRPARVYQLASPDRA